ncbi:selenocysteine-specific translation elongation factor [Helicobacter sp. 13S00477-4]|uniref:selenocysteine-specific translation elongation factor n=1 Tax=Helicobacter sp. 13S00477-4 TaxID=1905759 RepID=UPI000BA50BFD|nr:selenocysteine-specific translation elongation factor [Helicobacter sp. 13S00477-4]PAF51951.1 selenocysteine-specific translation elongation factor [Helicobacter sp. 13S00477-4]
MKNDLIVGLGGHIDHGKTSLVKALNGFDGDQRTEEKQRGITLDISFSNLSLPETKTNPSRNISFIDVPGHEKLIKNMIAGAFSIDVFLLIIDVREGIKPQSIEHLQIADILGIPLAICILSKIDLLPKPQIPPNLKIKITDTFSNLKNTKLHSINPFSIYDAQTHTQLKNILYSIPKPIKKTIPFFRYYIDRSFSLKGLGSIVTGSILSGSVDKNEQIYICDLDLEVGIKHINNHQESVEAGITGQRIALNLKNIQSQNLKRGFLLSKKGYIRGFDTIDVVIYPLIQTNLHNTNVDFFIGAKKCSAKISLLQELTDHQNKTQLLATLKTSEKIFSIFDENFILRDGKRTIAGGKILNPITDPMKKKQKCIYLNYLLKKDFKNAFLFCSSVHKHGFGLISSTQRFGLTHQDSLKIAYSLNEIFIDAKNLIIYHPKAFQKIQTDILSTFEKNKNALLSATSIQQKNKWASIDFIQNALQSLEQKDKINKHQNLWISKKNNIKNISEYLTNIIYDNIHSQGFTPLAPYDLYQSLDIDAKSADKALKTLCSSKKIIRLQHNLFITQKNLSVFQQIMRSMIEEYGYIDIAILKQKFVFSRKYLIAYLDSLDSFDDISNTQGKRTFKYKGKK